MKIIITESEKREIYSKYNISNDIILETKLIPTTKNEIRDFQNWVINTIKDKKILGVYGADGKWGPKTQLAWSMYGGKYPTVSSKGYGSSKGYSSPSNLNPKKGYPYDKLSNNPSSKFIAWVIKKSNGGITGNDTEAYAEAAFNAIKTPQQYSEVAKYLGVDPYNYISDFMDTKQRFHLNPVYNYFITLYGVNPNDRPKQFKPKNVKDFQLWVINTKKDRKILGRYGADGDWGSSSLNAWFKYGNEYLKNKTDDNLVIDDKSNLIISKTFNRDFLKYVKPEKINAGKSNYLGNLNLGVDTCAAFTHAVDSEMPYVGDAWLAYNNSNLGPLVFSAFKDLSDDNKEKLGKLYSDIIKNNGGNKDGKFNNQVGRLVKSFIKPLDIKLQLGDVIGMYNPTSHNHEKALVNAAKNSHWYDIIYDNPYFDKEGIPNSELFKSNEGIGLNTHVGVVGAIKDGVPIIFHTEDGNFYADPANRIVGGAKVAWVRRLGEFEPISYNQMVNSQSLTENVRNTLISELNSNKTETLVEKKNTVYQKYSCVPVGFRPVVDKLISQGYNKKLLKVALGVIGRESSFASGLRYNILTPLKNIGSILGIDTSVGPGQMNISTSDELKLKKSIKTIEGALIGVYKYLERSYEKAINVGYDTNKPSSNFNDGTGNAALDITIASYNSGIDKITKYCEKGLSKSVDKTNPRNTKEYWLDLIKKNPKSKKYYEDQIQKIEDVSFETSSTSFMGKIMNKKDIKVFCDSKNNSWVKNYLPNYPTQRWDKVDITTFGYVKEVSDYLKKFNCF